MTFTTEEFIVKARHMHGDFYDYSVSKYTKSKEKIDIICPKHGIFNQKASHHTSGIGCPKCGKDTLRNRFIARWSDEENMILSSIYPKNSVNQCAKILNRCPEIISRQIKKLGLITPMGRRKSKSHFDIKNFVWRGVTNSAKSRGLSLTITIDDVWKLFLKQKRKCALTGWDICFGKDSRHTTASIDRIDSNKGYDKSNIQLLHKTVNRNKLDTDERYFYEMCKAVYLNRCKDFDKYNLVFVDDWLNDTTKPIQVPVEYNPSKMKYRDKKPKKQLSRNLLSCSSCEA